ncbi:MAG: hypothetical protein V7727_05885 [Sneathiella sp.]
MHEFFDRIVIGRASRQTISKYATGIDRYLGLMTVFSAALLGAAISTPIGISDDFLGLSGSLTIFTALVDLIQSGQGSYAVAGAVLFIALPIFGISAAFDLWYKYEIHGAKFEKYATRAGACGRFWYLLAIGSVGFVYMLKTSENGIVYIPVYYLFLSVMLQKLVLTRMTRLTAAVKFVDEID